MEKTANPADLRRRFGDGRQYGMNLKQIKENHRRRYNWAADRLRGQSVVDAGCGVGYGSWILGENSTKVTGLDFNRHVIEFAKETWKRRNVEFLEFNLQSGFPFSKSQSIVAFEVIEHLVAPQCFLCSIPEGSVLFGSVPNQEFAPHSIISNPFHIRHYTYRSIERLLDSCGFDADAWYHQGFDAIGSGEQKDKTILFTAKKQRDRRPSDSDWNLIDELQFELLRRSNVISALKNGNHKTRGPTAF